MEDRTTILDQIALGILFLLCPALFFILLGLKLFKCLWQEL